MTVFITVFLTAIIMVVMGFILLGFIYTQWAKDLMGIPLCGVGTTTVRDNKLEWRPLDDPEHPLVIGMDDGTRFKLTNVQLHGTIVEREDPVEKSGGTG